MRNGAKDSGASVSVAKQMREELQSVKEMLEDKRDI